MISGVMKGASDRSVTFSAWLRVVRKREKIELSGATSKGSSIFIYFFMFVDGAGTGWGS